MSNKSLGQPILSTLAGLGVNMVPLGLVLFSGQSPRIAMALYLLETFVLIALSALRLRIMAPANASEYHTREWTIAEVEVRVNGRTTRRATLPRNRKILITIYLTVSLGFTVVLGVFVFVFAFLVERTDIAGVQRCYSGWSAS